MSPRKKEPAVAGEKKRRVRTPALPPALAAALAVRAKIEKLRSEIPETFATVREVLDDAYVAIADEVYLATLPPDVRERALAKERAATVRENLGPELARVVEEINVKEYRTFTRGLLPGERRAVATGDDGKTYTVLLNESGVAIGYARGEHLDSTRPEPAWRDNVDRLRFLAGKLQTGSFVEDVEDMPELEEEEEDLP